MTMEKPTQTAVQTKKPVPVPHKHGGHWRRRILGVTVLLLVCVIAMLPQILSTAALRQQIADSIMQDFDGKVEIGGADLAWWKPAQLSGMTMVDQEGETLAKIESAEVSTPLWRMLWPGKQPLQVKISRPVIMYEIDAYGRTNWERVFKTLDPERTKRFHWPEFRHAGQPLNIVVEDGRLIVKDRVSERTIETEQINIELKKSARFLEGVLTGQTQLLTETEEKIPAGDISANFQLVMAGDQVVAGDVKGEVRKTPLELIQPWLKQAVPHLHIAAGSTDGTFESKWTGDWKTGLKLAVDGTLSASDIAIRSTEIAAGNELVGQQLTGQFKIDNTLPTAPGTFDIQWQLVGSEIRGLPPQVAEEIEIPADAITAPLEEPLILGALKFQTQGVIDALKQKLNFSRCDLGSDLFSLRMAGDIQHFASKQPLINLEGQGSGDLLPFLLLVSPERAAVISGKRLTPREFAIHGRWPAPRPATVAELEEQHADERENAPSPELVEAVKEGEPLPAPLIETKEEGFSAVALWDWEALDVYGVQSSTGSLWTRLEEEQLRIVPVDLKIGEKGQFLGKAVVDLRDGRKLLKIEEGYILKDVEFTVAMCRTWLKYVSPIFADATDLEGHFSLYMNESQINLERGLADQLEGVLQIADCRLGPGPLVLKVTAPLQGVAALANRSEGRVLKEGAIWMELPKQDVMFKKHDGRVYHDQLTFQTGKVSVISQGSVGEDQTLDLALTIPLDFAGEGKGVFADILADQPIQIHVSGTMKNPEVDASQLANFGKQFGVNAIDNLIQGLMERRRQRGK